MYEFKRRACANYFSKIYAQNASARCMRRMIALYAQPPFVATVVVTVHNYSATFASTKMLHQSQEGDSC